MLASNLSSCLRNGKTLGSRRDYIRKYCPSLYKELYRKEKLMERWADLSLDGKKEDPSKLARDKYSKSKKGKENQRKYETSDLGKEKARRYVNSEKGQLARLRYRLSPKGVEAQKRKEEKRKFMADCYKWILDNPGKTPQNYINYLKDSHE